MVISKLTSNPRWTGVNTQTTYDAASLFMDGLVMTAQSLGLNDETFSGGWFSYSSVLWATKILC